MAVDGRKLRKPLYLGSDEFHDFPCSPCAKEGKNVAAAKHCVECDENLCKTCLNHHNKFTIMKGHQLLDKVKSTSGESPEMPSQRCDRHGGKLIDVYCPSHDKVGCSTCIAVEHSACQGISFIPDIAKHSKSSKKLHQLETAVSSLESRFIALKQRKQKELDISKREKDKLLQEIQSERKKINDHLDKMEKELLNEVEATFKIKMQNIESDIKEVEDTLDLLRKDLQKLQVAKSENITEKYVQVKLGQGKRKIATAHLESLERCKKNGRLWFDPSHLIIDSKSNILGQIISYSAVEVDRFAGQFDISVSKDNTICRIYDMCLCDDGNIIMTDYNNNRIKKMNESYTITSSLTVGDNPCGICQIDESFFAVTLINSKRVQFISKKEPMTLQKSFSVGDRCRGIAYNDGLIYVCCGGSSWKTKEGAGHIEIYTTDGELMKSYYDEMGCPIHLTVPNWRRDMYFSNFYGDVQIIHKESNQKAVVQKDTKLKAPGGFCWINRNQVCIAGLTSNNIVLMSSDGKMHEELLTVKDGITKSCSMCFDKKHSRLVVSAYESDKIKVYNLKISKC